MHCQPPLPKRKRPPTWSLIAATTIGLCIILSFASCGPSSTESAQLSRTPISVLTPTQAPTQQPTLTVRPTQRPMPSPTPKPQPTQPKPAPTQVPQKSTPAPTHCIGVNNNPWCYDFNPGNYITNPPSAFCSYFTCVSTFWTATRGYVAQCVNSSYTHSGGVSGACSRDGGVLKPLYSH